MIAAEVQADRTERQVSPTRQRMITPAFDKVQFDKNILIIPQITYKSFQRYFAMSLILAISSFQFGYALCEISTVPIPDLIIYYNITMDAGLANGVLVGIMPIGGIFGCLLNRLFIIWFSRKNAHFVVSAINILSAILVQINTMETIIIGRFVLGICCGIYTAIAPQYIKEIAPTKLRPLLGSFFSLGRVVGIVFCYALGVIFVAADVRAYYRIIFAFPGGLAIFQSIMIFLFVPDSPVEMLEKFKKESLRAYVIEYYRPQAVDMVVQEMQAEFQVQQAALNAAKALEDPNFIDHLSGNRQRAFIMAIHLNIFRQFIGVNTIVAFAGQMVTVIDKPMGGYANLILNGIQFVFTCISTFWLANLFGRRPLYLISALLLAISSFMVMLGYLIDNSKLLIAFMILYMIFFGLFYAPVSWSYPAEIIPATKNTLATTFTWIALALTTLIPPIVMEKMNGNAYPLFLFFGVYTALSFFYMLAALVESKGMKYKEIIEKY